MSGPPEPPHPATAAWRLLAVSVEGSPLEVGGVDLWRSAWRDAGSERVPVVDPHYGRSYLARVYEAGPEAGAVRFAAVEFSNLVWGIYLPA